MALPPRFLNSVYDVHPDDDSMKEVTLHAKGLTYSGMGDRHVLLQWNNATTEIGPVMQIIQLTGQSGNYSYYVSCASLFRRIYDQQPAFFSRGVLASPERRDS